MPVPPQVGVSDAETLVRRAHLAPQTGTGFTLRRGELLKIIDPQGEQVSDLTSFALDDAAEWLSSGRTIDYANTIYVTAGHTLYSNRSRAMWTIIEDTVGRHDFLLTPCSPETFTILYKTTGHHPSCFENLATALAPFGISPDAIPTTLNVFMNVDVLPSGELSILPPRSRAGDHLLLRAEMDLIVGVTACSAELSNNGSFKPIDVEVHRAAPAPDAATRTAPAAPASA
ncbi:MAG: urea carboxylase-associated family protein [Gemmatimonadota bacterium]|nr:urea carboxylase-associated family protein [Gemmatimonadota bacterium]